MKKIILALMMMASFTFASFINTSLSYPSSQGSCYYDSANKVYFVPISAPSSFSFVNHTSEQILINLAAGSFFLTGTTSVSLTQYKNCRYDSQYGDICDVSEQRGATTYNKTDFPECANLNSPEKCDNVHGQFVSASTGQCVDCMPFPTFEGRATCACDAGGSTYKGNSVSPIYSEVVGNYSYSKQSATCANGSSPTIYYDPVSTSPADNNNTTPTDNNTSTNPTDTNNSTPTDGNTTTPTPTQAAVVQALKDIQNGQKDATTALKDTGVDVKAIKEQMTKNGTTFNDMLAQMQQGNAKTDKMYQLMDDEYKGQAQYRNAMGKWIDKDLENAAAQLGATVGVKDAVNGTTGAVNNATNAINTQGEKLGGKLDDILQAIKDGNGTDMKPTNDILEKINKDTNSTASGVSKLHDDLNTTNDLLGKIASFFDSNTSVDTNGSGSSMTLDDMLPSGGSGWFSSNALDLNFGGLSGSGSNCQCATAEFFVSGKTYIFPPPELLSMIPFSAISKLLMALIYILGLKTFLRI